MTEKEIRDLIRATVDEELRQIRKTMTMMTWTTFASAVVLAFHVFIFPLFGGRA